MSERINQVAMRIKSLREISGKTADAVAKKLKVAPELYASYESGAADIPVSILYEIAGELGAELTSLLTGEEPRLHEYSLVRSGKGPSVDRRKQYKYNDLAYNFAHKKGEFFLITVKPRPASSKPKPYSHAGHEFTHVLEGVLRITLDGHELVLKKGDSLYFDSMKPHAMAAMQNKKAVFLAVIL